MKKKKEDNIPVRLPPSPTSVARPKANAVEVKIITTLYTALREKYRHPYGQGESKTSEEIMRRFHSRAMGIWLINQGRLCGFFGEYRVGRIL
ncbi:hypothetical protein F5Y15DRAFT_375454 [Xylariaceae sp. FL0016]|nr:hypothetical protein F5Y15DRAFT_375454 [Xylariaceae sp. FL0016]